MDFTTELYNIDKKCQDAKIKKAKLEERLEQAKKDLASVTDQLTTLGVKVEDLDSAISNLAMSIENDIDEYKAVLNG